MTKKRLQELGLEVSAVLERRLLPLEGSISMYVIFMIGAGCRPEAPVAEGGPVGLSDGGEPTGQVPWGAGAESGILRLIESHKQRCLPVEKNI